MENPQVIEFIKFVNRLPILTEQRSKFVEEYAKNLREEARVDANHKNYFENEILNRIKDPLLDLPLHPPLLTRS
jgi:hypothetical protein